MLRNSILATFAAVITLLAVSQQAHASCGPLVSVTGTTARSAIDRWQGHVANTMNDLYSDWSYARKRSVTRSGKGFVASGIPCNTR